MSQEKVDKQKEQKLKNKNFDAVKKKKKIITILVCLVIALGIGCCIYLATRPDYSDVNTGASIFDDAAIAQLAGADYDFSSIGTN